MERGDDAAAAAALLLAEGFFEQRGKRSPAEMSVAPKRSARVNPTEEDEERGGVAMAPTAAGATRDGRSAREQLMGSRPAAGAGAGAGAGTGAGAAASGRGRGQQQQQVNVKEELESQERDLDEIGEAVGRIHGMATAMDDQLGVQRDLLENMDSKMQQSLTGMEAITRRTTDLVKKAGGPRPFVIICFLVTVAIVLLMFIIYF